MKTIKIGQKVKIKNFGKIYTTYTYMFEKLGFKNKVHNYIDNENCFKDSIFTVFGSCNHFSEKKTIVVAIEDEKGNQFLFSKKGLEFIETQPTYTITKEQLTYLHSVDSIKETIEDWFPNEFPKIEIGKWYKGKMHLMRFEKIINDIHYYYGFYYSEYYDNKNNDNYITNDDILNNLKLATEKEVSKALIAEAKKRGFKSGVNISAKWYDNNWTISKNIEFKFNSQHNCLEMWSDIAETKHNGYLDASKGHLDIFKDGVWAEIISKPIEVTLEEIAKFKGCNVEQLIIKE